MVRKLGGARYGSWEAREERQVWEPGGTVRVRVRYKS